MRITSLRTIDVRFPTSQALDGSDAMKPDPDYSAAYVILGLRTIRQPRLQISNSYVDALPFGNGFSYAFDRLLSYVRPVCAACFWPLALMEIRKRDP